MMLSLPKWNWITGGNIMGSSAVITRSNLPGIVMIVAESESDTRILTDIPYLALTGELWGVCCEHFWRKLTAPQCKWAICTVTQAWCLVVISYVSYLWHCLSGRASFLGFGLTDCRNVFVSLTWDYSASITMNVEAQAKYICVDVPWHGHNARLVYVLVFVYCISAGASF